jgi:predicted nucleic acid-binding protein
MSLDLATKELETLVELFPLLPESNRVFEEWRRLVTVYKVSGKSTHDARLVATMIANGIPKILTFNVQDFVRYREIEALHPGSILP